MQALNNLNFDIKKHMLIITRDCPADFVTFKSKEVPFYDKVFRPLFD